MGYGAGDGRVHFGVWAGQTEASLCGEGSARTVQRAQVSCGACRALLARGGTLAPTLVGDSPVRYSARAPALTDETRGKRSGPARAVPLRVALILAALGLAAGAGVGALHLLRGAPPGPVATAALDLDDDERRPVVAKALARAAARATGCGVGRAVRVRVTFLPSGEVISVRPDDADSGALDACVESAFRELRLGPFSGAPLTVTKTVPGP